MRKSGNIGSCLDCVRCCTEERENFKMIVSVSLLWTSKFLFLITVLSSQKSDALDRDPCWALDELAILSSGVCINVTVDEVACLSKGFAVLPGNCSNGQECCYTPTFFGTPTAIPLDHNASKAVSCGIRFRNQLSVLNASTVSRVDSSVPDSRVTGLCWMVSIFASGEYIASGILINSEWIITSASATKRIAFLDSRAMSQTVFAIFGLQNVFDILPVSLRKPIKQVVTYPGYRSEGIGYPIGDLALVRLDTPLDFSINLDLCTACLPDVAENFLEQTCHSIRYGTSAEGADITGPLRAIPVSVMDNADCSSNLAPFLPNTFKLDDAAMCGIEGFSLSYCMRNDGSPLICDLPSAATVNKIAGIFSWGNLYPCIGTGIPSVFTALSNATIQRWILFTAGQWYLPPAIVPPESTTPVPPLRISFAVPPCTGTDILDTGAFPSGAFATHPLYPTLQQNPGTKKCRVNMTAPVGKVLKISLSFITQYNCDTEYWTLFFSSADSALLGTSVCSNLTTSLSQKGPFCRVNGTMVYVTPDNYAVVEYCRTDAPVSVLETAGFAVRWETLDATNVSIPKPVPQTSNIPVLPEIPGNFSTALPPSFGTYANYLNVTFILQTVPNYFIHIWMTYQLESNSNCLADYLAVSEESYIHGKFCGQNQTHIISKSTKLSIQFVTDSSIRVGGIFVEYKASLCGDGLIQCPRDMRSCLRPQEFCDHRQNCPNNMDEVPVNCGLTCGQPAIVPFHQNNRIVGGSLAIPYSWPWQIVILDRKTGQQLCGGSLIGSQYVVTNAHCFVYTSNVNQSVIEFGRRKLEDLLFIAGENNLYSWDDQDKTVLAAGKLLQIHPAFTQTNPTQANTSFTGDVALVKLKIPILFRPEISPVCLPKQGTFPPSGTICIATGWGSLGPSSRSVDPTPDSSQSSYVLKQVSLQLLDQGLCKKLYSNAFQVPELTDDMVCAGGQEGICNGDSGGPLVCKLNGSWILHGGSSWGDGCGLQSRPGVFIRMAFYADWIERTVREMDIQ